VGSSARWSRTTVRRAPADFALDDVLARLRAAGADWSVFRDYERRVRDAMTSGKRHAHEAELKARRRA
jgi:DNA primase